MPKFGSKASDIQVKSPKAPIEHELGVVTIFKVPTRVSQNQNIQISTQTDTK